MFDRVLNLCRVLSTSGFWIYLWFWICQIFKYTRVLNILGLHRVLSMPEYCLGMPFTSQKALRTSLKLSQKAENCYPIVKNFLSAEGFLARFAHFSWLYNFYVNSRPAVNLPHWPEMKYARNFRDTQKI